MFGLSASDPHDLRPGLQALECFGAVRKRLDHDHADSRIIQHADSPEGIHAGVDGEREQHVHDHARRDDQGARPDRLGVEVTRAGLPARPTAATLDPLHHLIVHAPHLHVAAEGDPAQDVLGLTLLKSEDLGTQADGEPLHLDPHGLGSREVAELVHEDQHTEYDDGGD